MDSSFQHGRWKGIQSIFIRPDLNIIRARDSPSLLSLVAKRGKSAIPRNYTLAVPWLPFRHEDHPVLIQESRQI